MSNEIFIAGLLLLTSFVGISFGGVIGKITISYMKERIEFFYVGCGGMLLGLLIFELVPHTFHQYDQLGISIGILAGISFMIILDVIIHKSELHSSKIKDSLRPLFFLVVAIAFHNLPTGLALGSNLSGTSVTDSSFFTAIALHQIPEGMALMISLLMANTNGIFLLFMALFLAGMLGLSTLLGGELSKQSLKFNTLLMGSAIGTLGFVTINEILWKSIQKMNMMYFLLFVVLGMMVIKVYLSIFMV